MSVCHSMTHALLLPEVGSVGDTVDNHAEGDEVKEVTFEVEVGKENPVVLEVEEVVEEVVLCQNNILNKDW